MAGSHGREEVSVTWGARGKDDVTKSWRLRDRANRFGKCIPGCVRLSLRRDKPGEAFEAFACVKVKPLTSGARRGNLSRFHL